VINPGGPGASGVEFERDAAFAYDTLNQHFDLVSFDPRGVGASRPIRCLSPAGMDAFFHADPIPDTAARRARLVAVNRAFADGCWKRNGDYLRHIGSIDTVRDMDVLRAALGDRKLTYYGASYGTYLGARFAELFPTHIRAMVLDGAVDPSQDTVTADIGQAKGFETNLDDFLNWCVAHSCPLGSTRAQAVAGFNRLWAQVRTHPLPVGRRSLGPGEFYSGVVDALYFTPLWPQLSDALASAKRGDGGPLLTMSDDQLRRRPNGTYSNLMEAFMAISCVDRQSPTSIQGFDAAAARARQASPHFGLAILYGSLQCAYWHVPPVEHAHPAHAPGAPPIVVVGTTHDPATPYVDAQSLTRELGRAGILLTLVGSGHTAYLRDDPCISNTVNAYLDTARAPRAGLRCR
jgi:pimeloyl-ACP methyl ester carboxylesterase